MVKLSGVMRFCVIVMILLPCKSWVDRWSVRSVGRWSVWERPRSSRGGKVWVLLRGELGDSVWWRVKRGSLLVSRVVSCVVCTSRVSSNGRGCDWV